MKISVFPACLSFILTAALSFLIYNIAIDNENCILLVIGTAISILLSLALSMAVKFDNPKVGLNIKLWSIILFIILFIVNLIFAWLEGDTSYYVILLTSLWVIHLFVVWKMLGVKGV